MKNKRLLVIILLSIALCFTSIKGYGEVQHWLDDVQATAMDVFLLTARLNYVMENPSTFLSVQALYDRTGTSVMGLPSHIMTAGRIYISMLDTANVFGEKTGEDLLKAFRKELEYLYSYFDKCATNMDTDIIATFYHWDGTPLGYFYQGEYHLWED